MKQDLGFGPIELRYAAALRGVRPRRAEEPFTYARLGAMDAEEMVCLAASNPEGRFHLLFATAEDAADARQLADQRGVANVAFASGSVREILEGFRADRILLPKFDYLCVDESASGYHAEERADIFELAAATVADGGQFVTRYRPCAKQDDALRFLVSEFGPELTDEQKAGFLAELRDLGATFFARAGQAGAALGRALAEKTPDDFLGQWGAADPVPSATLATIVGMAARGFAYAGDAHIPANYLELCTPAATHEPLLKLRAHILYEPIKDFATDHVVRTDIWVRQPVGLSDHPAELFGGFTYGLAGDGAAAPRQVKTPGKNVDLTGPLFDGLFSLMAIMPITVGDFVHHETGKGFDPVEVVGAIQLLVALGLVLPMRASYTGQSSADMNHPRLAGSYNRALCRDALDGNEAMVASVVAGRGIRLGRREALVLQAVDRGGMAESAGVLLPELQRLAHDPVKAQTVLQGQEPTPETAMNIIVDVCTRDMIGWYALGILAA